MAEAAKIGLKAVSIPFILFVPLIKDVSEVFINVVDLCQTAQHNKRIAESLQKRIEAANTVIGPLNEDELYSPLHYANLQGLVLVLKKMENFCANITQYNKLQKILEAKSVESKYKDLCEDYNISINELSLSVNISNLSVLTGFKAAMTEFKNNSEKELKILRGEIDEVLKFQNALFESMVDANKKSDKKLDNADEKLDNIVKQVGEMNDTMQKLQNEQADKAVKQKKIDSIFNEVPLLFDDYKEANEKPRTKRLRKYIHKDSLEEYAFKTVEKDHVDQVKNQVTILKKIRTCQNIIRFYGFTEDTDQDKYYLVTEWAEKGNLYEYIDKCNKNGQTINLELKLRFAYGIAKGLNFLNTLKIVHRDIRSENVVITDDVVAKITNFKLSRGFNEATGNIRVEKESARNNSPEILRRIKPDKPESEKKQKYNTKCEVYSFGILLWELAECKVAYQNFEDIFELMNKVMDGYREKFSSDTDIPEKYKQLVTRAVDQDPSMRPTFANMLTDLQDIFRKENPSRSNTSETSCTSSSNTSNSLNNNKPKPPLPVRKKSLIVNWNPTNWNPQTMTIDEAIKHHKRNTKEKSELYKCFDSYSMVGNPKGNYWKAFYITKGWSDLKSSQEKKDEIASELFKEAADYGDSEAQLRYAIMAMEGKGVEKNMDEAIEYLLKAAENNNSVAMFNVATYYFSHNNEELGRYYMTKSANSECEDAIRYCEKKNIPLV